MENPSQNDVVAVVGAGPAGLFAAQALAAAGVQVALLNRDIRPGGLAEYGIYFEKHAIKAALRKQFQKILADPKITYYGNVTVSQDGDLSLETLRRAGFRAVIATVGAQGTKLLGIPGESLEGVYHAKDLIYYYNGLPPYSESRFDIGKRIALIGVGNVMADIAHWSVRTLKVDEVTAVARRGPEAVKFTRQEMEYVANNLDLEALDGEFSRVADRMRAVGQDPEQSHAFILSALPRALEKNSNTRMSFRFLSSPSRILGDHAGKVAGLEVDDTRLELRSDGSTRSVSLGSTHILDVDTVIYCIGDKVSETFGLPVEWDSFVKHPAPRFPVDNTSYEAYDPVAGAPVEGVFVAGWAREASKGQVGLTRKDAGQCAKAVLAYLATLPAAPTTGAVMANFTRSLQKSGQPVISKEDTQHLEKAELAEAQLRNQEGFRFVTNADMLRFMGFT